jgi:hypothetical protein
MPAAGYAYTFFGRFAAAVTESTGGVENALSFLVQGLNREELGSKYS